MEAAFFITFFIVLPGLMLLIPMISGAITGRRHDEDLARREAATADVWQTDMKSTDKAVVGATTPCLLTAEVSLGIDHFRAWLGQLKHLIGGQLKSYERSLIRARREALVRLSEEAKRRGYNAVVNVRLQFADISGSATSKNKAIMVSVIASGTAYQRRSD